MEAARIFYASHYTRPMKNTRCVHLIIEGRVQGVGYRAFTKGHAKRLALDGWVRNLKDGNVEAIISRAECNVDKMLVELRIGPLAARVRNIKISECNEIIQQGFNQLETA
jgi:acylphosphatase